MLNSDSLRETWRARLGTIPSGFALSNLLPSTMRLTGLLGALAVAFLMAGSLTWPLGTDQAIFVWVGKVILGGGLPYHDAWDVKGPLTYYVYASGLALFRDEEVSIRILDLIFVLGTVWAVRRLTLQLSHGDKRAADFAAIFIALDYYADGFWDTAQPDGWGGMLTLAAVSFLVGPRRKHLVSMALAGGAIGLATLLKPTFALLMVLPVVACVFERPRRTACFKQIAVSGLMFTGVAVVLPLVLLGERASKDLEEILMFLASGYAPKERHFVSDLTQISLMLFYLGLWIPLLLSPWVLWSIVRNGARQEAAVMLVWIGVSALLVVIQGRYWPYQWMSLCISLSPFLGLILSKASSVTGIGRVKKIAGVVMLLICLSTLALVGARAFSLSYGWSSYVLGLQSRLEYIQALGATWGYDYVVFRKAAAYINSHSHSDDKLLVWGLDVQPNLLSMRESPTRFGVSTPLVIASPLQEKYRGEFIGEVSTKPPQYIAVDDSDWDLVHRRGRDLLKEFPQFDGFISNHYTLVARVGYFEIWSVNH